MLLYLPGGLPEYFLTERYPTGLDNDFTVVWCEQRGAGLSYHRGIPAETITGEQFITDTLSVTDYLRNRFGKETDCVSALAIPAYFFHGVHDYTVNYQLAKDYHDRLAAPLKGFYTFERSAHSPVMEEPQKACRIMREDVLAGTNNHADDSRR